MRERSESRGRELSGGVRLAFVVERASGRVRHATALMRLHTHDIHNSIETSKALHERHILYRLKTTEYTYHDAYRSTDHKTVV